MSQRFVAPTPSGVRKKTPTRSIIRFCVLLWIIALLGLAGAAYGQSANFAMNPRGLQSLTYNGHQLIADPSFMGDFCYGGISTTFKRSDGTTYNGATNWSSSSMDIDAKKVTLTFTWGTATCTYSKPISNRINFLVTLTNSTSDTLISATGKLLIFYTPTASPNVYYSGWSTQLGSIPLWTSFQQHAGPLLIDLSTVGKMAITNDNPVTSSSAVGGLSQYWYNQLFGLDWTIADPIGPSATGKLKTSMRFGSTSSTILGLAGDTYQRLDAQYPCQFNWTDRRLMGRDFLSSTTPHPADGENPRGWFNNDDSIDITTQSGLEDFQTRMINHTTDHIAQLTAHNCQGLIVWDIEGQQMPHAISYVGDPDMMDTAAPEMNFVGSRSQCVADEIFQLYRDAGLKVGICIRPQQYVSDGAGGYIQVLPSDPGQEILDDVTYAYERWGVTMFYIDSTVNGAYAGEPLPASLLFDRVMKKYPNFLYMAENQQVRYYGYGAPYDQTGYPDYSRGTPSYTVELYQGAATLVTVGNYDGSWYNDLVAAVKRGDMLSTNTWYWGGNYDFQYVADIYDDVGARPSVSITSPSDYSVSANPSSISVSATANGNGKTLQKVEFYAGSVLVGTDSSSPYTCSWTNFAPGNNYCLYAKATTTDSCSAVSLPVHVKIAPTYEQVGSTLAGPYATPNSVASDTVFSSTGDIPSELTIQNGVIPDQCIEYTLSVSGVSGYTSVGGNSGLALFAGSTPAEADGLFTGVYHYDNSVSRGALADDLAESTTPYGPQKTVSSSYTVTVDVTDGVINTYLDGVHWQSYAPTAADIANWAGQTKFAAFHSGPGTLWQYAKASISNVKFYKPSKVATPTFSPAAGTYKRTKTVGISCTTSGATIRYTTDGSEPLPDSTQYTSALSVPGSCIIKAKAFKTGYKDSDTASATYTITRVWTQTGSTIAGPYWTPDAMGGGFSSTIDMPSAVTIQGGAIPDMKVEYTLTVDGVTGWGYQPNGNSGLAMYLSSTPSSTDGAFTGVCHPDYWTSRGAIVGNIAAMPDPAPYTTPYTVSSSYTVSAEIVGGVATTTITGVNCRYYSVTSTDVSNWSGQTKFAAFHCNPWSTTDYGRAGISNIKFYTGETAVTWVQIGNTITTQYATGDPPIPNGYTTTAFSSVGDMPSELAVSGGVAPDFKVTYDLKLLWSWWYGAQYGGNSGFALYQNSTPSTSGGLYGGMNGNYSGGWYSTGAFTGNVSNASGGTGSYTLTPTDPALTLAVTEQKVGSTVTTTITGQDSRDYTVTSTDISNWTGKSKFAAFRGPTGQNWNCGAVGVTNITFYKGE